MVLNKRKLISGILCLSVISGIYLHNSKYISDKELDETYRIKTLSEKMLEKHEKEIHRNKMIEDKQKEIVVFLNSEEYSIRQRRQQTLDMLINKTGLNVVDYQEINFELSFYSSLPQENIFGAESTDCRGNKLNNTTIANNLLKLETSLYIENFGYKKVLDRGSDRFFNNISKCDVFIPRINGESDEEYFKRVQNMGRIKNVKGYILELK